MNSREKKMISILKELKSSYGVISVKAEFEAEGTRIDELYRLIYIARISEVKIGLKIGGCEAIRDLMESKQIGVDFIIAPMIESSYAVGKFIEAKNKIYSQEEQNYTDFLFNIETILAFENLKSIMDKAACENGLDGVVFGRVDFTGSLGLSRTNISDRKITNYAIEVGLEAKNKSLDYVVGGAVSIDTIESLKEIDEHYLTRFETRKIIFDANSLKIKDIEKGLKLAVYFELLWLLNKRDYYQIITDEDNKRIEMLQSRWKLLTSDDI